MTAIRANAFFFTVSAAGCRCYSCPLIIVSFGDIVILAFITICACTSFCMGITIRICYPLSVLVTESNTIFLVTETTTSFLCTCCIFLCFMVLKFAIITVIAVGFMLCFAHLFILSCINMSYAVLDFGVGYITCTEVAKFGP